MRQITAPVEMLKKICGRQKRREEVSYRMSSLCIQTACEEGTLLYHTLTGELCLLADGGMTEADCDELIRNWFLVPEEFDERAFASETQHVIRMLKRSGDCKTDFTILTTTDCNARCFYCYEIGIKRISMTKENARETADYMIRSSQGRPLRIRWFGGEPLYNVEAIDEISGVLRERGASFRSSLVTNGYYLGREIVQRAVEDWNLKKVQITIDGTEDIYNRTKAYIGLDGTESPFKRVMDNIKFSADAGLEVLIRLNMDARNASDLLTLSDQLAELFSGRPNVRVYLALLQEFAGKIHAYATRQEILHDFYALEEVLESYGLLKPEKLFRTVRTNHCLADNDDSEVILPDGRTGRCDQCPDDMITGSIRDDRKDQGVIDQWKEPLSVPECAACVLYPLCTRLKKCQWNTGGCPETEREITLHTLQKEILQVYRDYRRREQEDV